MSEQAPLEGQILTSIGDAVKPAMIKERDRAKSEGFEDFPGFEGWKEHVVSRRLGGFVESVVNDPRNKGGLSIWAVALFFNQADPDLVLLQTWDRKEVGTLVGILQKKAEEVFGKEEAGKIENIWGADGRFDPKILKVDVFGIAAEAIEALRKEKLLPVPLTERLRQAEGTKAKLFETNSQQAEKITTFEAENERNKRGAEVIKAAKEITQWPDDLREEQVEERLWDLPEEGRTIFEKAQTLREAEFREKDIPKIIQNLSLLERMAVMLNFSGKVEQKIAVTPEGQPCELFNLMFPEVSGMGSIAKVSRSNDGSLMLELSAMFPDKKGSSIGRYNLFQLPIMVDDNGTLRSSQDVGKVWKELPKQVKNWLEDNLLKEAEFTARLRDPQKTTFRGLSNYFRKRQAFLKDGSLKFVWDSKNNLFSISGERDNRSGGPGR